MSYMVIARRWRPQDFDSIVGQEHVTRTLKNAILQNRIAHSFLFTGPRGVGKTTTARVLAKALNCDSGPTETPCQKCIACTEISEGNSLDVIEIDGASNTSVDDVRTLRENVKFMPTHGRYKIYIIDEVHMLSKSAFNALLKTLEEPPSHVIFVFATTEPHKIPLTIISRCQRFDFKKIPYTILLDTIKKIIMAENISIEDKAQAIIARNADGSLRDAETLLDQIIASFGKNITEQDVISILGINRADTFFNFVTCIKNSDLSGMLDTINEIVKQGHDLDQFLKGLIEHFRNLLIAQTCGSKENILDLEKSEIEQLTRQSKEFTKEELLVISHIILSYESQLSNRGQIRYQLEFMCLKINTYGKTIPITELAEKVLSLEEKIHNKSNIQKENITKNIEVSKPSQIEDVPQKIIIENKKNAQPEIVEKKKEAIACDEKSADQKTNNIFHILKEIQEEAKNNKKIMLATCLELVKDIEFEDSFCIFKLEEGDTFHRDSIEKLENKKFIEDFLSQKFQTPKKIKIEFVPITETKEPQKIPKPSKAEYYTNAQTQEPSIIKKTLNIFDGKVVKNN